ncbi:MAG: tRNA guanosine(34) transglycosylase Tgt [Planctomycetia bacterium TMED53]|nr:MAG: tRNA guanosine(34) transglycosylase Tgt [Planctomycetia bacterium TMED53]
MTAGFDFEVAGRSGDARAALLTTPRGQVATPAFMPVGTQGTVKGMTPDQLKAVGTQIVLSNTYHLAVRPGVDTVRTLGGLHTLMGWEGPILTDSGGFQVFSLGHRNRISEQGVEFRNHVDGSPLLLTPESVLDIQARLGSTIAMILDECPAGGVSKDEVARAVVRTHRWALRAHEHRQRLELFEPMAVFGIMQGGTFEDLRRESAQQLLEIPFDAYAVGGVSVGEGREALLSTIGLSAPMLPFDRPRYLMGVGGLEEFIIAVDRGIDLFDCVIPTRNARNASLFLSDGGSLNMKNARHKQDSGPIEEGCDCLACTQYSRGTLHHLYQRKEILAYTLGSIHNLRVFHRFLENARKAILEGTWDAFRDQFLAALSSRSG